MAGLGGVGLGLTTLEKQVIHPFQNSTENDKPATNINDALQYPRNKYSMPGMFPGKVIKVVSDKSIVDDEPVQEAAYEMISMGMCELMEVPSPKKALKLLFNKRDRIGLKVNPVAGPSLTTSHAVVKALIKHLEEAGISRKNLMIWDRREFQLHECGFDATSYPGIEITGTEQKDKKGSYYNMQGRLYSEEMVDKEWYFWADVEGEYDEYTLPYMVNGGKFSYFTKLVTRELDKIINIPILKNAGSSVTLAMKNIAYGAITNTGRLHQDLWAETCAEVCAFPPLRDKVVLNIVDGLKGCFNGGPAANPQFFTYYKTLLFATDPVAIDRIGYDIVLRKRMEEGIQKEEVVTARKFMELAEELKLGIADAGKIVVKNMVIS